MIPSETPQDIPPDSSLRDYFIDAPGTKPDAPVTLSRADLTSLLKIAGDEGEKAGRKTLILDTPLGTGAELDAIGDLMKEAVAEAERGASREAFKYAVIGCKGPKVGGAMFNHFFPDPENPDPRNGMSRQNLSNHICNFHRNNGEPVENPKMGREGRKPKSANRRGEGQ